MATIVRNLREGFSNYPFIYFYIMSPHSSWQTNLEQTTTCKFPLIMSVEPWSQDGKEVGSKSRPKVIIGLTAKSKLIGEQQIQILFQ